MRADVFKGVEAKAGWRPDDQRGSAPGDYFKTKRPPVKPERRIKPFERLPMYHVAQVGGDEQVDLFRDEQGRFKIHTRDEVYDLEDIVGGRVVINIGQLGALNMLAKAGYLAGYEEMISALLEG